VSLDLIDICVAAGVDEVAPEHASCDEALDAMGEQHGSPVNLTG